MFFLKKQPDEVDVARGTMLINNFLLDGWTTNELFLRVFGENAAPSKKQATYLLQNTSVRLGDIEFISVLVQFSPLGLNKNRVAENVTLYAPADKNTDFIKRVAAKIPDVKPETLSDCEFVAVNNGIRITAHVDTGTMAVTLNFEYLDSASRVDNWIPENADKMVTPKSGAIVLNDKAYHANLREQTFKSEVLPLFSMPDDCFMDGDVMTYAFHNVMFYDLHSNVSLKFLNNKLTAINVTSYDAESLLEWAHKHFGAPTLENSECVCYSTRAAGAREWDICIQRNQPQMSWTLKPVRYT